jgi:hypothetical protein
VWTVINLHLKALVYAKLASSFTSGYLNLSVRFAPKDVYVASKRVAILARSLH